VKAAAVVFNEKDFNEIKEYDDLISLIKSVITEAQVKSVDLLVFPALLGCLRGNWKSYVEDILRISINYQDIHICPGSYYEDIGDRSYHSSCIIKNGRIVLKQRQLYLARWERSIGLSRGNKLELKEVNGFKTAIILSTDAFYPQVSRQAALMGANLVICPMALRGGRNLPLQTSGVWNNVQMNLFFGIESGLKGDGFFSYSAIHAPLDITDRDTGLLTLERGNEEERILACNLDEVKG
jgi:predicted amidohydrolase